MMRKGGFVILFVIMVGALCLLLGACSGADSNPSSLAYRSMAEKAAKKVINETLKSPHSAIWHEVSYLENNGNGDYIVYVDVEATNSFGAYIRTRYFVIVSDINVVSGQFTYNPRYGYVECQSKNDSMPLALLKSFNSYEQETVAETHTHTPVVDPAVFPTCTTQGKTEGSHCSSCGAVLIAQKTLPVTHQFDDNGVCKICNYVEGLAYSIVSNGLEVKSYTGTNTNLVIPSLYDGKQVVSIGTKAFYYCSQLESISLPNSILSIGDAAFNKCEALVSINVPQGVNSIGYGAFAFCNFSQITIPDSVHYIDGYAFYCCQRLESIAVPSGVTELQNSVFAGCFKLSRVTIPKEIKKVEADAFAGDNIDSIVYNGTISDWLGIEGLGNFMLENVSSLYIKGRLIEDLVIPDGVTKIPERAFAGYSRLRSITIGGNVEIGDYAFNSCGHIEKFTGEADSISKIVKQSNPESFSVEITSGTTIVSHAFYNSGITSIFIPSCISLIDGYAFCGCENLESIQFAEGSNLSVISGYAFSGCRKLKSISIPDTVKDIWAYAFANCTSLSSIIIPDGVTAIKNGTFYNCSSLTSITIPASVTRLYDNAFAGHNVSTLLFLGTKEQWQAIRRKGTYGSHFSQVQCKDGLIDNY